MDRYQGFLITIRQRRFRLYVQLPDNRSLSSISIFWIRQFCLKTEILYLLIFEFSDAGLVTAGFDICVMMLQHNSYAEVGCVGFRLHAFVCTIVETTQHAGGTRTSNNLIKIMRKTMTPNI